jgi:acetyl esterase/lipase
MKIWNLFLLTWIVSGMISCSPEPADTTQPDISDVSQDTTLWNISYGNHPRQRYDIHLPENRNANTPVVLLIHGGAWKAGQKEDMNSLVQLFKSQWKEAAVVNMNYRLASLTKKIHHEEIMTDIRDVITHVTQQAEYYQISTDMAIMGASAGGQLAMIYAYKYNQQKQIQCVGNIFGPAIISDYSWYNSTNIWLGGKVGDILTEYVGVSWDTTAYHAVSPYWNISNQTPPTIIFHGSLDPIVPVYQSRWMRTRLNELNVPNEYHEYLAFHSFDATQSRDVINKSVAFFKKHMD